VGGPADAVTRGSEQLRALVDAGRDNFLWERLATLAAPGASPEALAAARKDALSRLPNGGSKSPAADLITRISAAAQPTLLAPSHIMGLLAALDSTSAAAHFDGAVAAAANLAVAAAKSAPSLCCSAMPLVVSMVTANPPRGELACTTAVRVLRHAARYCPLVPGAAAGAAEKAVGAGEGGGRRRAAGQEDAEEREEEEGGGEEEEEGGEEEEEGSPAAKMKKPTGKTAAASRHKQQQHQPKSQRDRQAATAAETRTAVLRALTALCQGPYGKAAKAAVHALWAVAGAQEGEGLVRRVAERLAAGLRQGCEEEEATPAVVQAMGSVGEVAPLVFAEHAESFAAFICEHYMTAALRHRPPSSQYLASPNLLSPPTSETDVDGSPGGPPRPSAGILLKCAALRAVCRGCTPDAEAPAALAVAVPTATVDVVSGPVEDLLVRLLSIEEDLDEYIIGGGGGDGGGNGGGNGGGGVRVETDRAHLRQAAAAGLLRLATRHDSRLAPGTYVSLALVMQDPVMEVRRAFGEEVRLFLHSSLQLGRRAHVTAKFAALLPLAAMDPIPHHRDAAARTLLEVVLLQRARAQQQATAAAAGDGGGGTSGGAGAAAGGGATAAGGGGRPSLADHPEFLLPFLVYVLGHHPDCPPVPATGWPRSKDSQAAQAQADEEQEQELPDPEEFRPFQDMLQFALEPLLTASRSSSGGGGGGG
ncbi:hypothetical protein Agub_g308, partial [Astrephomene gubernaculifera]